MTNILRAFPAVGTGLHLQTAHSLHVEYLRICKSAFYNSNYSIIGLRQLCTCVYTKEMSRVLSHGINKTIPSFTLVKGIFIIWRM